MSKREGGIYDSLIARLGGCVPDDEPWTTEHAETVALADYLATCDDAEYVEYFEMFGIELGRE